MDNLQDQTWIVRQRTDDSRSVRNNWREIWNETTNTPIVVATGVTVSRDGDRWEEYGVRMSPEVAQLISAVPDLVTAAREVVDDLKHYVRTHGPGPNRRLEKLLAAITKAEGQK